MSMKKTLITGGAGFIGSHIVEGLTNSGHRVVVLDNLSTGKKENLDLNNKNLEFVEGDILNNELVEKLVEESDYVIHLAAIVSVELSVKNPDLSKKVNLDGAFNVINAAKKFKKRLFFASSAAVYGNPTNLPICENHPQKPISPYGLEKYIIEQYCQLYNDLFGFSYVCGRFFNVFGERQDPKSPYSGVISIFNDKAKNGEDIFIDGDGKQTRDFIYVKDLSEIVITLLFSNENGIFNVGTGAETSIKDLANKIIEIKNSNSTITYRDERLGDIKKSFADISKLEKIYKKDCVGLEALRRL